MTEQRTGRKWEELILDPRNAVYSEPEWLEWFDMTPSDRFAESERLLAQYLEMGGTLDPEPDTQSPFFDPDEWREICRDGRTGVRLTRGDGDNP